MEWKGEKSSFQRVKSIWRALKPVIPLVMSSTTLSYYFSLCFLCEPFVVKVTFNAFCIENNAFRYERLSQKCWSFLFLHGSFQPSPSLLSDRANFGVPKQIRHNHEMSFEHQRNYLLFKNALRFVKVKYLLVLF